MTRQDALEKIIALMDQNSISVDEITARLNRSLTPDKSTNLIKTLLGYVGGVFIFSGLCLLVGMIWDNIGSIERVIITLGSGLTAFILAIISLRDARFEKAATPFFLVFAVLQPAGFLVFLNEYVPGSEDPRLPTLTISLLMAAQCLFTFQSIRRGVLLFIAMTFWTFFMGTALTWMDVPSDLIALTIGSSLFLLSYATDKTEHRAVTPFWYFIGTVMILFGFFSLVDNTPMEILYLGVNAFMVYASIRAASRTVLFASIFALMGWLSWFTGEYFADVTGWPLALILIGFMMIGLSTYAIKLGKKIRRA